MSSDNYDTDVFINCPFDRRYKPLFRAIVFAIFDCGFRARCAFELGDASVVRIDKIFSIISECRYGIHDISRTQLDPENKLPRFNMPLELGMFLSAKRFGRNKQKNKMCLILDSEKYRYQKFISDIAGQDVKAHDDKPEMVINIVRNWIGDASKQPIMPGGAEILKRFKKFSKKLPQICKELKLKEKELTFNAYADIISKWLKQPEQTYLIPS